MKQKTHRYIVRSASDFYDMQKSIDKQAEDGWFVKCMNTFYDGAYVLVVYQRYNNTYKNPQIKEY